MKVVNKNIQGKTGEKGIAGPVRIFKNVDVDINGVTGETVKYRCGLLTERLCYLVVCEEGT